MVYNIFSQHAPTGESSKVIISSNPYSSQGRNIGYPSNLDVYTRHISDVDGSQSVQETREITDIVGSKLYLHHRPLVNSDGTATTITVSDGTIDTNYTNARQGYIVFSSLPSSTFTVSYVAVPDCDVSWAVNTLQDSVMELQKVLGPTSNTGYPGVRNLKIGLFDSPEDATASGVLQNAVYLSHLDRDLYIGSSDDASLQVTRGTAHTIQLGRATDKVVLDVTGFTVQQSDGTKVSTMILGSKTGDNIYWKGQASGAGPLTIGGPEWATMYSGKVFSTGLTGSFYTGSMLRVHGDASFMGNVKAIGNITIVNTTGTTSTVIGDWTIGDELFVNGISHLNGLVDVNDISVNETLYINKDLIALNNGGAGGNGQSLIDGLDCSELAWNYNTVIKSKHNNNIITAPLFTGYLRPKNVTIRPWLEIGPNRLLGDVYSITGQLNAAASNSGAHPNILQLLIHEQIVSGGYTGGIGSSSGSWSAGLMQPGTTWIRMLDGPAAGLLGPIYGHTVEQTTGNLLTRLNVFIPEPFAAAPQTNNKFVMYNPQASSYDVVRASGGASPTFTIHATSSEPLAISFEDDVRILTADTASYSMLTALQNSTSGFVGSSQTGIAYIFADSNGTDPESPPLFKARATPMRMPGQTPIGEVVALYSGSTWTVLESISYRPGGTYDSAWIPVYSDVNTPGTSGRCTPGFSSASTASMKVYFHHYLGGDVDIGNISANLYLGAPSAVATSWNQTATPLYSYFGQDFRALHGLSGAFIHVPLGAKRTSNHISDRDASIFYLDSALIGVDVSPALMAGFPMHTGTTTAPTYMRLIVNKNN